MVEKLSCLIQTIQAMRIPVIAEEYELQNMIADNLLRDGISFQREYRLGPRNRIDFLIEGGIGLEVKKRKPNRLQVISQLERYAANDKIKAIVLVIERSMDLPREVNGKPCSSIGLNKLWGVAL